MTKILFRNSEAERVPTWSERRRKRLGKRALAVRRDMRKDGGFEGAVLGPENGHASGFNIASFQNSISLHATLSGKRASFVM